MIWDGSTVRFKEDMPNAKLLRVIPELEVDILGCEIIQAMGMAVGREVFETCFLIGRIRERCRVRFWPAKRTDIKRHHCHSLRAKDKDISQALRNRIGEKGTARNPGPTFGVSGHCWSALAVATYVWDRAASGEAPVEVLSLDL